MVRIINLLDVASFAFLLIGTSLLNSFGLIHHLCRPRGKIYSEIQALPNTRQCGVPICVTKFEFWCDGAFDTLLSLDMPFADRLVGVRFTVHWMEYYQRPAYTSLKAGRVHKWRSL